MYVTYFLVSFVHLFLVYTASKSLLVCTLDFIDTNYILKITFLIYCTFLSNDYILLSTFEVPANFYLGVGL